MLNENFVRTKGAPREALTYTDMIMSVVSLIVMVPATGVEPATSRVYAPVALPIELRRPMTLVNVSDVDRHVNLSCFADSQGTP